MTFYRSDVELAELQAVGTKEGVTKGWLKRKRAVKEYRSGTGVGKSHLAMKLQQMIQKGGFTYDPMHAQSPKKGYAVSVTKQFETIFDATKITAQDIVNFLSKTQRFVQTTKGAHLGGWVDMGQTPPKAYLDISVVYPKLQDAVRMGQQLGELGIYGLAEGQTYDLKKNVWRAAKAEPPAKDEKPKQFKCFMVPWEAAWDDPAGVAKMIRKMAGGK